MGKGCRKIDSPKLFMNIILKGYLNLQAFLINLISTPFMGLSIYSCDRRKWSDMLYHQVPF